jgi:hypothetical protein
MSWSECAFNYLERFVGLFHLVAFGYCFADGIIWLYAF